MTSTKKQIANNSSSKKRVKSKNRLVDAVLSSEKQNHKKQTSVSLLRHLARIQRKPAPKLEDKENNQKVNSSSKKSNSNLIKS